MKKVFLQAECYARPVGAAVLIGLILTTGIVFAADVEFPGSVGITGPNATLGFPDGTIQSTAGQPAFMRTIVVMPIGSSGTSPADHVVSGTLLKLELNTFTGTPSARVADADHRWLVKLEPGIYDLDGDTLQMHEYVDIEGSGKGVTVIRSNGCLAGSGDTITGGTVRGTSNAEIRSLTIENTGSVSGAECAAFVSVNTNPVLTDVVISTTGTGGHSVGIHNWGGWTELRNVSVTVSGGTNDNSGVLTANDGLALVYNSSVEVTGTGAAGFYNKGSGQGAVRIYDSNVGTLTAVDNEGGFSVFVVTSMFGQGAGSATGWTCIGAWDMAYATLDSACQ